MKLASIFSQKEAAKQPWTCASCNHPKTLSFRSVEDTFKTMNLVFSEQFDEPETTLPWLENSSSDDVAREARSERLFFEAAGGSSSILEGKERVGRFCLVESLVVSMESENPYVDFRKSMEEMVECGGFIDWEFLEEMLSWYLRVNGKKNHGFIVGAFLDLLIHPAAAAAAAADGFSDSGSYTSSLSSFASSF